MVQRHDDPRGEPNWQPVTAVTMMAGMLTGQLAANREQLELLERARREPWLLDDATVDRVKKVFGVQRDDMWLWEENGRRWQALDLDTATRAQVDGYMSLAAQFATTNTEVLAQADEIADGTHQEPGCGGHLRPPLFGSLMLSPCPVCATNDLVAWPGRCSSAPFPGAAMVPLEATESL
jgi:hypothetical protein